MVTITIGNSTDKIRIGDHVTPGNGTYEWYLNGDASFTDDIKKEVDEILPLDKSQVYDGYNIALQWSLTTELKNNSDYLNMFYARFYWAANNKILYLSVKNSLSDNNLARMATYAAPTTNIDFKGQIKRIAAVLNSASTSVRVLFKHYAAAT